MRTVNELLDKVKANSGIQSDYRLAKTLNLSLNTMSNYRHGRSRPDDLVLSKLAELGGIPADEVELLAVTLQADRAATAEAREMWQRIAARLMAGTVHSSLFAVLVALGLFTTPPNAHAVVTDVSTTGQSVYYVNKTITLIRGSISRLWGKFKGLIFGNCNVPGARPIAPSLAFA